LYYCLGDDQVPFMNSVIAEEAMINAGATDIQAINMNDDADHGQCVSPAVTAAYFWFLGMQEILDTTVGTIELDEGISFSVSPNPAQDYLKIDFEYAINEDVQVDLFSINGGLVRSFDVNQSQLLNVADMNKGMYILTIQSAKGIWSQKVVIE